MPSTTFDIEEYWLGSFSFPIIYFKWILKRNLNIEKKEIKIISLKIFLSVEAKNKKQCAPKDFQSWGKKKEYAPNT